MKKIIFLLVLMPFLTLGQGTWSVSFWDFQSPNDTLTIDDSVWVTFKYTDNSHTGTLLDTMRLSIEHINSDGSTDGNLIEVFKMAFINLDNISKEQDGTTKVYFTIPSISTGKTRLSHNYSGVDTKPIFYVKEKLIMGLLSPIRFTNSEETRYYNEQGMEIPKPDHGFFIWRCNKGQSGKSYISF